MSSNSDQDWPSGFEEHKQDQIRYLAANTTAEQRLTWLEETLRLLYRNGLIPNKMDLIGTWPEPGER